MLQPCFGQHVTHDRLRRKSAQYVDVLRTLRQLLGLGLIELRDPDPASGTPMEGGEASGDQPPR